MSLKFKNSSGHIWPQQIPQECYRTAIGNLMVVFDPNSHDFDAQNFWVARISWNKVKAERSSHLWIAAILNQGNTI